MLGRKLIVIAAAVALALAQETAAASHHSGKVTVRHRAPVVKVSLHKQAENATAEPSGDADEDAVEEEVVELCLPGWTEVSVETVEGVFCAQGQICVADIKDGSCPEAQQGLPYGAYCDVVKTGVYGCKPKTKEQAEEGGKTPLCSGEGESPMSVEGVEGVFCVTGQACVADIKDGACPGPQEGLPNGAVCGKVKTGVYGCKPADAKEEPEDDEDDEEEEDDEEDSTETVEVDIDICTGEGESPMSVEGVEGVFCVTGQACVADIKDGACPGPQDGLTFGSYCGTVKTGVYGCKPKSKEQHENEHAPHDDKPVGNPALCSGKDESPMSVEGVEGIFCVTGQACVADIADGACPGPQEGLPNGAVCGKVKTGVYGCKPAEAEGEPADDDDSSEDEEESSDDATCGEGESPMSVEGVEGIFCVKGQACVADIADGACPGPQEGLPNGAVCGKVKTGVYGCKPAEAEGEPADDDDSSEDEEESNDDETCGEGESPMSVEGVEGIFCVKGQACVADIKDGACPGPQDGLPNGAVCGVVKTGVYGCKPAEASSGDHKCGDGESPMSVEGVEGIFCVSGQACVADIKDGACPGPQDGLPNGAECGVVQSGVYGCKPKAAKRHRKSATKGHSIKVVKAHAKKTTHKKH